VGKEGEGEGEEERGLSALFNLFVLWRPAEPWVAWLVFIASVVWHTVTGAIRYHPQDVFDLIELFVQREWDVSESGAFCQCFRGVIARSFGGHNVIFYTSILPLWGRK
jgi:hypothetical protein